MDPVEFEVGGVAFRVAPLKPLAALEGLALLTERIFPAIVAAPSAFKSAEGEAALVKAVATAATGLPAVYSLFVGACKVNWQGRGWVSLADFAETVFARNAPLMIAWLAECLRAEYGAFLSESGRGLMGETASRFASLGGFAGNSGA